MSKAINFPLWTYIHLYVPGSRWKVKSQRIIWRSLMDFFADMFTVTSQFSATFDDDRKVFPSRHATHNGVTWFLKLYSYCIQTCETLLIPLKHNSIWRKKSLRNSFDILILAHLDKPWTTASGQKCLFATLRYVA